MPMQSPVMTTHLLRHTDYSLAFLR